MAAVAVCLLVAGVRWRVDHGGRGRSRGRATLQGRHASVELKGWRVRVRVSFSDGMVWVHQKAVTVARGRRAMRSARGKPCKRAADAVAREILRFADKTEGSVLGWLRSLRG